MRDLMSKKDYKNVMDCCIGKAIYAVKAMEPNTKDKRKAKKDFLEALRKLRKEIWWGCE